MVVEREESMYLFNVSGIGMVEVFLFEDQFETEIEKPDMLQRDLKPSLVKIENGKICFIRNLKKTEYDGEFQNQNSGRKFMKLSVNGVNKDVYFDTFYSMPYQEIINLLNQGKKVSRDLLLSCFMKYTEDVAAIIKLMSRDTIMFGGMSMCNPDKTKNILCVPKSTEQYPKENWHYKMTFAPIQESMSVFVANMTTYTDDICSMINSGHIKLVNKQEYIDKLNEAGQEIWKKASKRTFFTKKMKGVNVVQIPMLYENGFRKIAALQADLLDEGISCLISDTKIA